MPNLKLDLLDKLRRDKYFAEIELGRLAQDPSMNYESKILQMKSMLQDIALLNSSMGLAEQYFTEPVPAPASAPNVPQGQVHPGQTHGE